MKGARRPTEAERLAECRRIFERAVADNVVMTVARDRLALQRWAEVQTRLAARRRGHAPAFVTTPIANPWWDR